MEFYGNGTTVDYHYTKDMTEITSIIMYQETRLPQSNNFSTFETQFIMHQDVSETFFANNLSISHHFYPQTSPTTPPYLSMYYSHV